MIDLGSFLDERRRAGRPLGALVVARRLGSSQALARRVGTSQLAAGARPGVVVVACEQTAGRGRRGSAWHGPAAAGVWASVAAAVADAGALAAVPLVAPVALCGALAPLLGDRCRIKWPNDLSVAGRKLGGVLVESAGGPAAGRRLVVVGFGVNTARVGGAAGWPDGAVGLAELVDEPPPLAALAVLLTGAVEAALAELPTLEVATARYRERLLHRAGETMRCRVAGRTVEGIFVGLEPGGRLLLDTESGRQALSSAELIEPPGGGGG